jgi:hypothetical protein
LGGHLTKAVAETYTDPEGEHVDAAYEAHIDRLHAELAYLPCSPECALRYGVQAQEPRPGPGPGYCTSKTHDREHLGLGGRRVLVSRKWSGKTLDRTPSRPGRWVRQVLHAAGVEAPVGGRGCPSTC